MFSAKGKFGWYELMTSDTRAAGKFYSDVVGWTTKEVSGADGSQYTTFNLGDIGMAGMLHISGHTAWIGYIAVDDVDAHHRKVKSTGIRLTEQLHQTVYGELQYAVQDLEGHLWYFGSYTPWHT